MVGALALEGLKLGLGVFQTIKGARDLSKLKRPEYGIPEEISRNLSEAERQALEGLPAEQKLQYVQNIERGMQSGLKNLSSRKGGTAGVADLVRSQNDAFTNLVSMDAAARQQNRMFANQARGEMAAYKDKAFAINKMDPYQQKLEAGQANVGSGLQNIFGALDMGAMLSSGMGCNKYQ